MFIEQKEEKVALQNLNLHVFNLKQASNFSCKIRMKPRKQGTRVS
jgi:hypothetical protein